MGVQPFMNYGPNRLRTFERFADRDCLVLVDASPDVARAKNSVVAGEQTGPRLLSDLAGDGLVHLTAPHFTASVDSIVSHVEVAVFSNVNHSEPVIPSIYSSILRGQIA